MKNESYPIDQSALFKVRSKRRLAEVLGLTLVELNSLQAEHNYHEFKLQPNQLIEHRLFQKKPRQIQNPCRKLKAVQKRILRLLNRVVVPDYLYSAVKGRSYIDNANQHKEQAVTFCVDIKDFYSNTGLKQVRSFFLDTLKCSPDVAFILSSIVCYHDKGSVFYCLPTGGPVSPLLAYWVNKDMFERLSEYASSHDLTMTVYVDDLTFSGSKISKQMQSHIISLISKHNYVAHKFKYYGARAWKIITGEAVKNDQTRAPNKLKAKMRIAHREYNKHPQKREQLKNTINGLATAIRQIDQTVSITFVR